MFDVFNLMHCVLQVVVLGKMDWCYQTIWYELFSIQFWEIFSVWNMSDYSRLLYRKQKQRIGKSFQIFEVVFSELQNAILISQIKTKLEPMDCCTVKNGVCRMIDPGKTKPNSSFVLLKDLSSNITSQIFSIQNK